MKKKTMQNAFLECFFEMNDVLERDFVWQSWVFVEVEITSTLSRVMNSTLE